MTDPELVLPVISGMEEPHVTLAYSIHPSLPPLRRVSRRTEEHVGSCPFCGGDQRSDRFHVWLELGKERFWCRQCNEKGPLAKLLGDDPRPVHVVPPKARKRGRSCEMAPAPNEADIPHYRALYAAITGYAYANLRADYNPEPLAYLHSRGLDDTSIAQALLGVLHRDPQDLVAFLHHAYAALIPYAEAAGVLRRTLGGTLEAHPNLCGCIVLPYMADGVVVDLRTRTYPGKGYRSLPGGYNERGAHVPFGWDAWDTADTVIVTEGEFKALLVNQAYRQGTLTLPAIAHPGLSYLRDDWPTQLLARGVRSVVLAYDTQPRPQYTGISQLAPEEIWTIRHGQTLAAAGLQVRVLRLPLEPGATKADLDEFLLAHGAERLQDLLDAAPLLHDYHAGLSHPLLQVSRLPLPGSYPSRRARPTRVHGTVTGGSEPLPTISLADARAAIPGLVQQHATTGTGMLVLAHPPGVGKGHGTTSGLKAYLGEATSPGQVVWTALRKEQLADQQGLELIPLHGRTNANCRKMPEAQVLAGKGYSVLDTLCRRRCPYVDHCTYLQQFNQEGDFFAAQPLLQATSWWQDAGVIVLDEFDPARLTRIVTLQLGDLAAMGRATDDPHAHQVLRWLGQVVGDTLDRALSGTLLLSALDRAAATEGLCFRTTLRAAVAALPPLEEQALLPGLPLGATVADYTALPPGHLSTLLTQLQREDTRRCTGAAFTSRLEATSGCLLLYTRQDRLIDQLANPAQPKVILDATVSAPLLQALWPHTPLTVVQPRITLPNRVVQVLSRDWAKSTLKGTRAETQARRTRWYEEVASHVRPDHPTLVVCTMSCEADLRAALQARGLTHVHIAHYGALRGSNAYKGYDVILAQVYHPNLSDLVRQGRALFADNAVPLDERIVTEERTLTDASGATWTVQVPTFADSRLQALLAACREAELLQAALRGRPFDHPDAQITLLFGLPLEGLIPTEICEAEASPTSNTGRHTSTLTTILAAGRRLLDTGQRVLSVGDLARAAGVSVVTVREHWQTIATQLQLRSGQQQRVALMPKGGRRIYQLQVLARRGRRVSLGAGAVLETTPVALLGQAGGHISTAETMTNQARNQDTITRLIIHPIMEDGSSQQVGLLRLRSRRACVWGLQMKKRHRRS